MSQTFVPGQRWLSDHQPELGLGRVVAVDARRVEILYGATGERRLYALPSPPLSRLTLAVGETLRDHRGRTLRIVATREDAGVLVYHCEDPAGDTCLLPESELDDRLGFNRPQQRLIAGRFDPDHWFDLRWRTAAQGMREAASSVRGLVGARVGLIPHQIDIAAEVSRRDLPRVLLADEVGLGKTIEAGLILHRFLLTGRARRVLVITPEPLLHQWLVEMLRRFNLRLALFDRERFAAIDEPNPFLAEQQVLCALDWLIATPAVARALVEADWDLLVVDEAHHLEWREDGPTPAHALVARLAERVPSVLLLTATPEQLGRAGHFGRLHLLDPRRFGDYHAFLAEERDYAPIAAVAARLVADRPLTEADRALLAGRLGDIAGLDRQTLIERLLDRHGTGRVMFRNTRAAVPGFPGRELIAHPLPSPGPAPGLDRLETDPRVPWLIDLLTRLRGEKLLLICRAAETVIALRELLLRRAGIHAAIFHEGMEIRERDRAAAYFAAVEEGTPILLCSEIGSEGRNFQFAHHLVLFDLPLDPDLLEQRIGRLDRIGQTRRVQIHVPYRMGTSSEVLFRWYAEGLNAFAAICPAASAVHTRLGTALERALESPEQAPALIAEAQTLAARLNAELAAGRDRLLELHSHRPERSAPLVAAIADADADASAGVRDYLERFWDAFGVEHEAAPGGSVVLRPGAHMLQERFPELPESGLRVTFDRAVALAHEHWEFLTWEHPMTRAAMELLRGSDLGTAALVLVRDPRFPATSLLLESLYVAVCPAPPRLEAERFMPATLLRLLIDESGRDWSDEIAHEALHGRCLVQDTRLASILLGARGARLPAMLEAGEQRARAAVADLRETACARMHAQLDEELDRLQALARVNPAVRPAELEALRARRVELDRALARAELRLDALRLIVAG